MTSQFTSALFPSAVNAGRKLTPFCRSKVDPPRAVLLVLGGLGSCGRGWPGSVAAGAVGLAVQGNDVGVVDEAVDGGGGDDVVAEGFAPAGEREVRGDHDRAGLVAAGDELEEQRCGRGVEGQVADLVDHQ